MSKTKKNENKQTMSKALLIEIIVFLTTLSFGAWTIRKEYIEIIQVFLTLLVLGLSTFPITYKICKEFKEKGYLISKSIGILINGFIVFIISSFDLLKYESPLIYGTIILISLINWIFVFPKIKDSITKEEVFIWLTEEIFLFTALTIFSYIRGFKNEIAQTEKYMDYGIIMSCYKAKYFPIEDMWMNGRSLNYYYYGQYLLSYIIKTAKISVEAGYNICLSIIIALSMGNLSSLIYNICDKLKISKIKQNLLTISTPIFTFCAANLHYLIYGIILNIKNKSYIVYDSTRYIGYNPDTNDKTIHEFPSYGFLLGDAHAYTINTIFCMLGLFLLFLYFYKKRKNIKEYFLNPIIIFLGFLIGNFQMINYWDFPIYFVVAGSIILYSNIKEEKIFSKEFWKKFLLTLIQGLEIIIIAFVTSAKFMSTFKMISSEIKLCQNHTPIYQLLVLWGHFIIITIIFIFNFIQNRKNKDNFKDINIIMILISLCGLGLVLLPEIIYIKDIYELGYARANTMFKLTYQAFILLSISNTYFLYRLIEEKKMIYNILGYIGILIFLICSTYPIKYIQKDYGNIFNYNYYNGLDGTKYLMSSANMEYYFIQFINENIEDRHTILELYSDSYSDNNKISTFTGNPTIYGWTTHEGLWNNYEEQEERKNVVNTIYTSKNMNQVKAYLKEYNVEYIFIGPNEITTFGTALNKKGLISLGNILYSKENSMLIKLDQDYLNN